MHSSPSSRSSPRLERRSNASCVRVVVAIQARLDREAISAQLADQRGLDVVARAGTRDQVLRSCARLAPAVLILDPMIPWTVTTDRVADVLAVSPRTRVLGLAPHGAERCAILNPPHPSANGSDGYFGRPLICLGQLIHEGAHGVLRRSAGVAELARAVRSVGRGRVWIGSDVSLADRAELPLTSREVAVARLVGRGASNKGIAGELMISEGTVKKHITRVLAKLGLEGRLQLGLCVLRHPTLFADLRRGVTARS